MHIDPRSTSPGTASWIASVRLSLDTLTRTDDAAARLEEVARLARYAEHLTAELVREARSRREPLSWAKVGDALGMSRQAANERFSDAGQRGASHRRYVRARRLEALRRHAEGAADGGANGGRRATGPLRTPVDPLPSDSLHNADYRGTGERPRSAEP